ncbi:MAG: hypothetical protein ACI4SG_00740 [Oligosphaeraceae bacterium]
MDKKRLEDMIATPAWATKDYGPTLRMHGGWVTKPEILVGQNGVTYTVSDFFVRGGTDPGEKCSVDVDYEFGAPIFIQEFQEPVADVVCWPLWFLFGRKYSIFFFYSNQIGADEWTPRDVSFSLFGKEYSVHVTERFCHFVLGTIHGDGTGHIFIDGADMGFFPYYVRPSWLKAK